MLFVEKYVIVPKDCKMWTWSLLVDGDITGNAVSVHLSFMFNSVFSHH